MISDLFAPVSSGEAMGSTVLEGTTPESFEVRFIIGVFPKRSNAILKLSEPAGCYNSLLVTGACGAASGDMALAAASTSPSASPSSIRSLPSM